MPRKQQGWITFQSSSEEQQILEQYCQHSQRTKTEILRELVRGLKPSAPDLPHPSNQLEEATEVELIDSDRERDTEPSIELDIEPDTALASMRISARNMLKGTVKQVVVGAVIAEVTLEIAPGVELVSVITRTSVEQLAIAPGKTAYAVIKSNSVMIAASTTDIFAD